MARPRRILVIAAHPDDEMLGAAGTMHVHKRAGDDVFIVILGQGELSRDPAPAEGALAKDALRAAAAAAAQSVGATLIAVEDLPDNAFDSIPRLQVIKTVEKHIAAIRPDVIYTHHAGDLNVDHQLTCLAVVTASRAQGPGAPAVLTFEVRSATDYAEIVPSLIPFRPNVWQELDAPAMEAKMSALDAYDREMRAWPHSRSYRAVQALAEHRGAQVGVTAAEAFQLLRHIRPIEVASDDRGRGAE